MKFNEDKLDEKEDEEEEDKKEDKKEEKVRDETGETKKKVEEILKHLYFDNKLLY